MTGRTVEEKIDWVIEVLSAPLTAAESAEGWTPESKAKIKSFFADLKSQILSGEQLPPLSIARALDHWGVISGEILEVSAQISNELRVRRLGQSGPAPE